MPYNFVADSCHTKKLCGRLSSSEVRFYMEIGRFAFLTRGNVTRSPEAHWKARRGLSISVNWTFLLCVTSEALRANVDWKWRLRSN